MLHRENWSAPDCSERSCPLGDIAFPKEVACSNKGVCDRSHGTCKCQKGFTGSACQKTECSHQCSQHGRCLSGASESDSQHFIHDKCDCDSGWGGYDCSEQLCPTGDDPATLNQVNEARLKLTHFLRSGCLKLLLYSQVQLLICVAYEKNGQFQIRFRDVDTKPIPVFASSSMVKHILEEHPFISSVHVAFSRVGSESGQTCA